MNPIVGLVYLHGVGDDGTRTGWVDGLRTAIRRVGGPEVPEPRLPVVAPDFSDLLHAAELPPPPAYPTATSDPDQPPSSSARRYRRQQAEVAARLDEHGTPAALGPWDSALARVPSLIDDLGERLVTGRLLRPVGRYLAEADRRRHVVARVREAIPDTGDVVIVAHSLGAVVALDLLRFLPDGMRVRCLVTAASGLARDSLPEPLRPGRLRFPHHRVDSWLNVFNPRDPVTRGRGIADRYPDALDIEVPSFPGDHQLTRLMRDPGVARVLADALARRSPRTVRRAPRPLARDLAIDQVQRRFRARIEECLTLSPGIDAPLLLRWREARSHADALVGTSATGGGAGPVADTSTHDGLGADISDAVSDRDLPAALLTLVTCDPIRPAVCPVPDHAVQEARLRVAGDLGVPPTWVATADRVAARTLARRGEVTAADWSTAETELRRRLCLPIASGPGESAGHLPHARSQPARGAAEPVR